MSVVQMRMPTSAGRMWCGLRLPATRAACRRRAPRQLCTTVHVHNVPGVRFRASALATDVISAGVLGLAADAVCQLYTEERELPQAGEWRWRHGGEPAHDPTVFDPRRLAALTAFSSVYIGAFLHFLYQGYPLVVREAARRLLARGGPLQGKLGDTRTIAHAHACAWVDNLHCGVLYIPAYFLGVGYLQGDGARESIENLRKEWWATYASCTLFWVPFMMGNFALMPPHRRVQAMAVGNLCWSVVIDYLSHRSLSGGPPSSAEGPNGVPLEATTSSSRLDGDDGQPQRQEPASAPEVTSR